MMRVGGAHVCWNILPRMQLEALKLLQQACNFNLSLNNDNNDDDDEDDE